MRISSVLAGLLVGVVATWTATARAETAQQAHAAGGTLLAQGDLRGSLDAYVRAARADRSNQEYVQQYMLVRRAILLEDNLKKETEPTRWERTAQALRSFYVSQGAHRPALAVDEQIHARRNATWSAVQLAETQLALDMAAEAAQVLSSLPPSQSNAATQSLLAVALARRGKADEARQIADAVSLPDGADPGTLYTAARMYAVVGNTSRALGLLTRCFEAVPPSLLGTLKGHAQRLPEFAALASSGEFAEVLRTESKVPESKCSGGSSCAGCPMRGQCPSSQNQ